MQHLREGRKYAFREVLEVLRFAGTIRRAGDSLQDVNNNQGRAPEELLVLGYRGWVHFDRTVHGGIVHSKKFRYDEPSGKFVYDGLTAGF